MFDTVLIAGLGLMGGSMAKTIKARTLSRVLGWNRTRATAEQALADGSIDAIATEALYKEADLVIIGLYPQATVDWLLENMPKMKKGCVIVDMVGVKQFMVDHLEQAALDAMQETPEGERLEVGYLFRRDRWRRGYATEAAAACTEYAF